MKFDTKTYYAEVARPVADALRADAAALLTRVKQEAGSTRQDKDCVLLWPEDGGALRRAFEALDDVTLATSALAYHETFFTKWEGGDPSEWKYADYADHVLRDRFKDDIEAAARNLKHANAEPIRILAGTLRVGDTSGRVTVGLATKANVAAVRAALSGVATIPAAIRAADGLKLLPSSTPLAWMFDRKRYETLPDNWYEEEQRLKWEAKADAEHDVEKVARAVVAIRAALPERDGSLAFVRGPDPVVRELIAVTATSAAFRARVHARASELEHNETPSGEREPKR
jgi:hypothetical protein